MALKIETGSESPPEASIRQFTPQEKIAFLRVVIRNKRHFNGLEIEKMGTEEAMRFGAFEIQKEVLGMLGLGSLITGDSSGIPRVRDITPDDIQTLAGLYRTSRKFYVDRDLGLRSWTNKVNQEIKPEEAREQGKMDELRRILFKLNRAEIVRSIDMEIGFSPGQLIWEQQRKTLYGELQ